MKSFSLLIKISLVISVLGLVIFVGLLLELGRHDPYGWISPPFETIESRDLWNERKDFYLMTAKFFLSSAFVSSIILFLRILLKNRSKLK
jgi:heme/copper-type cytochrome/quinol oxidase subunit 1